MKHSTFILIALFGYLLAIPPAGGQDVVSPTIKLGSGTVESGSEVRIPITLDNHRNFIALQFDIAFEPSMFAAVDASQCLSQLPKGGFLADCRRQDPPNDDVVRFLVFAFDFDPIPSGVLGHLGFRAAADAISGISPLSGLECTGLGISPDQQTFDLTVDDYQPGEITVLGAQPSTQPKVSTDVLDLDGEEVVSQNPVFRRKLNIPDPIPVLDSGPQAIVLKLPGGREVAGASKRFIPRKGYVERLDCSGNQVPDANPETPVSFRWYGELDNGGWLGLTVVDDIARGTLVTEEASYQISGRPADGFQLAEVDPSNLPPTDAEVFRKTDNSTVNKLGKQKNVKLYNGFGAPARSMGSVELELLIMYTAQAEIDAGGPAGLDALIQQSIDDTNQAFINSGIPDLSVKEVHRELLTGFAPSGNIVADRDQLRLDPQILFARDASHADVTMVLIRNLGPQLGFCGAAYIQSPFCGGVGDVSQCGVGTNFEDYAISMVSVECAVLAGRNTFAHELGHLMGGEHQPGAATQAPSDASFVWSFAHSSNVASGFGTILWTPNPSERLQALNFSNPDIPIGTQPSGIANQRDNVRTFEALTPVMEQYRSPPPELIFADGFESP